MAGDDNNTEFNLNLDNSDFLKKLSESKDSLLDLANSDNVSGLIEGMVQVGEIAGVAGAAFLALKGTMDIVFDAEQIKQINDQFETLTENAGLSTEALKTGLTEAAGGLVSETDLLKSANKALVEMGDNADKLPEILGIARAAANTFGGDVTQRFDEINEAIATGNVRALKHMGLVIDQNKAYIDYAKSIGVSVDALSQSGKQQAILNAVLSKGKELTDSQDMSIKEATNAWEAFKSAITEIGEAITLAFDKTIGPTVTRALQDMASGARETQHYLKSVFGEGDEAVSAKAQLLEDRITKLKQRLEEAEKPAKGFFSSFLPIDKAGMIAQINSDLEKYQTELKSVNAQLKENKKTEEESTGGAGTPKVDSEKVIADHRKLQQELLALRLQRSQAEQQLDQTEEQASKRLAEQEEILKQQTQAKIAQIEDAERTGKIAKDGSAEKQIEQIRALGIAKLKSLEMEEDARKAAALQQYVAMSDNAFQGVSRAFLAASAKNKQALTDWGHTGQVVFDNFSHNAVAAFQAFGSGQEDAATAAKNLLLKSIGETAEAKGTELLLTSIYPPDPLGIAGGGALIAFGSFLQSQAGGAGGSMGAAAGGGGGGVPTSPQQTSDFGTRTDEKPTLAQQQQQKMVTVQVQGNYFETEQTKTALVDLMRQATDATAFRYQQIGQQ